MRLLARRKQEPAKETAVSVKTIRIIEDNTDLAFLTSTVLEPYAYNIITTTSNFDRLRVPEAWNGVDIVICDLRLSSKISGEDILRYLRDNHPRIMRIVYSVLAEQAPEARELAHYAFTKPNMPIQNLHWTIQEFFEHE
jgi:CheY-like chemotaxis protein